MDLSNSLDAVLSRRSVASAERAAEARNERQREDAKRAAVDHGEAVSQKEEPETAEKVEPTGVYDRVHDKDDTRHLIDLVV